MKRASGPVRPGIVRITVVVLCLLCSIGVLSQTEQVDTVEDVYQKLEDVVHIVDAKQDSCTHHLHVVIGLDMSGSMNGTERNTFLEAWNKLIDNFFVKDDRFTIVPFAHSVSMNRPSTVYGDETVGEKARLNGLFTNPGGVIDNRDGTTYFQAQEAVIDVAQKAKDNEPNSQVIAMIVTDINATELKKAEAEATEQPSRKNLPDKLSKFLGAKPAALHQLQFYLQATNGSKLPLVVFYGIASGQAKQTSGTLERNHVRVVRVGDDQTSRPQPISPLWGCLVLAGAIGCLFLMRAYFKIHYDVSSIPAGRTDDKSIWVFQTFHIAGSDHSNHDAVANELLLVYPHGLPRKRKLLTLRFLPPWLCQVIKHQDNKEENAVVVKQDDENKDVPIPIHGNNSAKLQVGIDGLNSYQMIEIFAHPWQRGKVGPLTGFALLAVVAGMLFWLARPVPPTTWTPPHDETRVSSVCP